MSLFVNTSINNNNRNVPTEHEMLHNFRNFHKTQSLGLYSDSADDVLKKIQQENNHIVLVYEHHEPEAGLLTPHYEVYLWKYTLHVFYYDKYGKIHHTMYTRLEDEAFDERDIKNFPYEEIPVVNFDYNTLRMFPLPKLEFVRSSI